MRPFWNLTVASNRRGIVVIGQAFAVASSRTARGVVRSCLGGLDVGGLRHVKLVAIGGDTPGVCGEPCFGGVCVGQHSELLWPHDLTDSLGAFVFRPCLVHWCCGCAC
jgi:hypothetical protein